MTVVKPGDQHPWNDKGRPRVNRPRCWHHNCNTISKYRVWSEEDESDAEHGCYLHAPSVINWLVGDNGRVAHVRVLK